MQIRRFDDYRNAHDWRGGDFPYRAKLLAEADRVEKKHAATRDISVTTQMFRQMREASLFVVIPEPLRRQYVSPPSNLISLSTFLEEVRELQRRNG